MTKRCTTLPSAKLVVEGICLHLLALMEGFNQILFKALLSVYVFFLASVRMFDLRHLEHSTIIYEDPTHTPLLRLAWNKQDPNYLATVAMDACEVIILDVRVPCTPVARYEYYFADGDGQCGSLFTS